MHWLLVTLGVVMLSGVAVLAWYAKPAADQQRRMWSDEDVYRR